MHRPGSHDAIRVSSIAESAGRKKPHLIERSHWLIRIKRNLGCYRTWLRTPESLANPARSLRVRLQAVLWFVTERASEIGVLLVHYSKPRSAHRKPANGPVANFEQIKELMFCWHPTKEELNQWVECKER